MFDAYEAYLRKSGVKIGSNCSIHSNAEFGSEPYLIEIGNHVRINSGVRLITHDGGVWVLRELPWIDNIKDIDIFGKIIIKDNVHIGNNAIIMPGVTIGSNCIIGCGAIVTHDIPDNSVAAGVPARVIETIEEYELKNRERFMFTKHLSKKQKKEVLLEHFMINH
ncbi:MAG: acyltransferase [Peptococcaceae bacterium]|nr:acyltransferase [Peptococcaceae bacterium]